MSELPTLAVPLDRSLRLHDKWKVVKLHWRPVDERMFRPLTLCLDANFAPHCFSKVLQIFYIFCL